MATTWHPDFAPSYTPKQMLTMGVFEGKYINAIKGLPSDWYDLPKVVGPKDDPDVTLNHFKVKSRQPLSVWRQTTGPPKTHHWGILSGMFCTS